MGPRLGVVNLQHWLIIISVVKYSPLFPATLSQLVQCSRTVHLGNTSFPDHGCPQLGYHHHITILSYWRWEFDPAFQILHIFSSNSGTKLVERPNVFDEAVFPGDRI